MKDSPAFVFVAYLRLGESIIFATVAKDKYDTVSIRRSIPICHRTRMDGIHQYIIPQPRSQGKSRSSSASPPSNNLHS